MDLWGGNEVQALLHKVKVVLIMLEKVDGFFLMRTHIRSELA